MPEHGAGAEGGVTKRKQTYVSVRESTHEKLRELARKNGEQISTTLDAIINRYLDEKAGKA